MWDLPQPRIQAVAPEMAGAFFTESPGKPPALLRHGFPDVSAHVF